jgi:hypothetical protein
LRNPITGIAGWRSRAARGPAGALPSIVMNSRCFAHSITSSARQRRGNVNSNRLRCLGATPCAASRRGRSGVLVQPFDDTVKRSGNAASSRNFLIEALVRDWIERCSCTRHCRSHYPPDPPKKAYVRRNEFVEGSDAALKSREEVQHARQLSKSKTHIS